MKKLIPLISVVSLAAGLHVPPVPVAPATVQTTGAKASLANTTRTLYAFDIVPLTNAIPSGWTGKLYSATTPNGLWQYAGYTFGAGTNFVKVVVTVTNPVAGQTKFYRVINSK